MEKVGIEHAASKFTVGKRTLKIRLDEKSLVALLEEVGYLRHASKAKVQFNQAVRDAREPGPGTPGSIVITVED